MIDTKLNYFGVLFYGVKPDVIFSCSICPPDDVCSWKNSAEDEFPVALFLWKEDEPAECLRTRAYLSSIFAALALLFSSENEDVPYCIVELCNRFECNNSPPIDLHLWRSTFTHTDFNYKRIKEIHDLDILMTDGTQHEVILVPADESIYNHAATKWEHLVKKKVTYLLDSADNAENYLLLKPLLDEWLHYYYEYPTAEIDHRLAQLYFLPWYADVLRSRSFLNPDGLRLVALKRQGQYALYDYFPERKRKFHYKTTHYYSKNTIYGKVKIYEPKDEGLPLLYDEKKHLHLLPIKSDTCRLIIDNIPMTTFFNEDWLN